MASKKKERMTLHNREGVTVLDLGEVEIWDGADLALLRETQSRVIEDGTCKHLGVDMTHVKYIPSGFFGMLFDWCEKGFTIRLYTPQAHVMEMLWFRQFFREDAPDVFYLDSELGGNYDAANDEWIEHMESIPTGSEK